MPTGARVTNSAACVEARDERAKMTVWASGWDARSDRVVTRFAVDWDA